jgi:ABC-type transporter Mla subunit MlaD
MAEMDEGAGAARSTGGVPGVPMPADVLRWSLALTGEAMRLPSTAAKAREVVVVLPDQLGELITALDRFTELLDTSLAEVRDAVSDVGGRLDKLQVSIDGLAGELSSTAAGLDQALPIVSDVVVRLDERVERLDDLVTQVSGSVVGTINAVPGLRRVARRTKAEPVDDPTD